MNDGSHRTVWWNVLSHPKMLFLAFGAPWIVYIGARDLYTTLFEKTPTQIRADRFAEDYRGQRWLRVEGRLLPQHAHVKASNNGNVNVDVPLVPLDWDSDQPVHIVRSFSLQGSEL